MSEMAAFGAVEPGLGRRCGQPLAEDGREIVSVRLALEWAFGTEHAQLDFDEIGASAVPGSGPAVGSEYRIMQALALGTEPGQGVRPDTSFGRSYPHADADVIVSVLRNTVPWHEAIRVAQLARFRQVPRWDLGPQRLQPAAWGKRNHLGQMGKTEVLRRVSYIQRGRRRARDELWVPCVWVPSVSEIAAARRAYLDWWDSLLSVLSVLRTCELDLFHISGAMPPLTPWKKGD